MSHIKVMISGFYKGGAWADRDTRVVFDPRKDEGKVFTFAKTDKLGSIMESIAKNHLVPFDKQTALEFEKVARDLPQVAPQVVEVRGKQFLLEVSFDRPIHPIPGKYVHVPTRQGLVSIDVRDAYIENHATAVFQVDVTGPIKIDAGAFIDDNQVASEAYPVEAKETKKEEKVAPVVEEVKTEEVVEAPKKKAPAKKRKKAEDAE